MLKNEIRNRTILLSSIALLSFVGCENMGNESPTAVETQPLAKSSFPASLSSAPDIIVNTTSDVTDFGGSQQVGDLPGPDGLVSLREAIIGANNTSGPQVIGFNISTSDPGFASGVFTIRPLSGLPSLIGSGTTIDGSTQTAFTGNTNPSGPEVVLNGGLLSGTEEVNALVISSSNNRIHSLVINGFPPPCCGGVGIVISEGTGNVVTGSYVGVDPTGSFSVANAANGIRISGSGNRIGGVGPGEGNVISGNSSTGISVTGDNNVIEGNFIGTDATGTVPIPNNGQGVLLSSDNNLVGGTGAGARNILSGNANSGVFIGSTGGGSGNTVQGNFIGTDLTGTVALGNGEDGIRIVSDPGFEADNNWIIGNLISSNAIHGIGLFSSDNNVIQGNSIGTDVNGDPVLGNGGFGIRIGSGPAGTIAIANVVGGDPNMGNIISANGFGGISIGNAGTNSVIGNMVSHNSGGGVLVSPSGNVTITKNSIFSNSGLGIDLFNDGVTPNDPGDGDAGPNNLMNFPVLTSALATPAKLIVKGTIDTPNPRTVTIEFFANPIPTPGGDPSGHGEGAILLGNRKPNSQGKFTATLPSVPPGTLITATATDANGNTSEFAANIMAQ